MENTPRRSMDNENSPRIEWVALSPGIRTRIRAVKSELRAENGDEKIAELNRYLMRPSIGMDDISLRMTSDEMAFYHQFIADDGEVHIEQLMDSQALAQTVVEGSFIRCVNAEYEDGHFDVHYELNLEYEGDGQLVVHVSDSSARNIQYRREVAPEAYAIEREAEAIEQHLAECFTLLADIQDERFHSLIEDLSDTFYEDQQVSGADRCRELGTCVTNLLNHPRIIEHEDYIPALEYILHHSIDDDVEWDVEGIAVNLVIRDNEVYPDDVRIVTLSNARYEGVTLLSPEFTLSEGKAVATGRMEPAFVLVGQVNGGKERFNLPLTHLEVVAEAVSGEVLGPPDAGWRERYAAYCERFPNGEKILDQLHERMKSSEQIL